jgi:hypothetical protein
LTKSPDAQGKSAGDGDDPDFSLCARGLLKRKRRLRARRILQHADKAAHVSSGRRSAKPISARQREHIPRGTDHQYVLRENGRRRRQLNDLLYGWH